MKLPLGTPTKLVRITEDGVRHRIPWAKPGWLYAVDSETRSVNGAYTITHVKDANGSIWTLGKGHYEPFEQN